MRVGDLCVCAALIVGCGGQTSLPDGDRTGPSTGGSGASGTGGSDADGGQGGSIDTCVDQVLSTAPNGVELVELTENAAFWSASDQKSIQRSGRDGGATTTLVADVEGLAYFVVNEGDVYYTSPTTIERWVASTGAIEVLATSQSQPFDPTFLGDTLYWLNRGSGILTGTLNRLAPDGSAEVVLELLGFPSALAADDTHAYVLTGNWLDEDVFLTGALLRIRHDDSTVEVLATDFNQPAGMAIANDRVYWIEQVDESFSYPGKLRSVAKSGGVPQTLASIDSLGIAVAADAQDVLYTDFDNELGARLTRVPIDGGAPELLLSEPGALMAGVDLDDDGILVGTVWLDGLAPPDPPSVRLICR